jgi:hypothetical protein
MGRFTGFDTNVMALAFSPSGDYLVGGLNDSTILVWDVRSAVRAAKLVPKQLQADVLERCWTDLASDDTHKAHSAIWTLIGAPEQSLPFLRTHLKPATPADPAQIRRYIAALDSDQFSVREAAAQDLERLGLQVESSIKKALDGKPTLETRRRLDQVRLAIHGVPRLSTLRNLRATMVLEHIGSSEAERILRALAQGAPAAQETCDAQASLERLLKIAPAAPRLKE